MLQKHKIKKYKLIELVKIQLLFLKYFLVQHDYYEKKIYIKGIF